MAGSDNRVTVVIDGKNDAGGAFAAATAEAKALGAALDDTGSSAGGAATALNDAGRAADSAGNAAGNAGKGWLANATWMQAGIAAGVAMAPVIATLATGLGGLGLAALETSKNTALMAQVLAPAKSTLSAFTASLQPEVLGVFNAGVRLASHLLADVQPVAAATGKALAGVLHGLDASFQTPVWQQFFRFMAATAGPDMRLVGQTFTDLLAVLPPLIQDLQPTAIGLLHVADAMARVAGVAANAPGLFYDTTDALINLNGSTQLNTKGIDTMGAAMTQAGMRTAGISGIIGGLNTVSKGAWQALKFLAGQAGATSQPIIRTGTAAESTAHFLQAMAAATRNLMSAEAAAVSAQVAYGNAILTSANDAHALERALDASRNKIGLNTAAQRASFGAANQYISDLVNQATQAYKTGHGVDAAMTAISKGLPILDSAKSKNQQYWQEVQTLIGWLDKLRAQANITKYITVYTQNVSVGSAVGFSPTYAHRGSQGGYASGTSSATPGLHVVHAGEMVFAGGERVIPAAQVAAATGGGGHVTLEIASSSGSAFDQFMAQWMKKYVRIRGGNVQAAFGRAT